MMHWKQSPDAGSVAAIIAPILLVVFVGFFIAGMTMPVLPLHLHDDLGFGAFVVGLVTGSQFIASLTTRLWAGDYADRFGPKKAVVLGLRSAMVAGALYLASTFFEGRPAVSAFILLVGRGVLGGAESLVITGSVAWGLARVGPQHAGKVIAWVGTAMFSALATGAPFGTAVFSSLGFTAIALATIGFPVVTSLLVAPLKPAAGRGSRAGSRRIVAHAVWLPGLGAALSSIGYGSVLTFSVLLFSTQHWPSAWAAVTCFAAALVVARILIGHLPDRFGGAVTAFIFVLLEVLGLLVLWLAPGPIIGLIGVIAVGVGYSLVFPSFGVAVVRAAPPENRGMAMGLYSACLDLALAVSGPTLGFVGSVAGLQSIFLASALLSLGAAPVALLLLLRQGPS
jgi:MFS family permease